MARSISSSLTYAPLRRSLQPRWKSASKSAGLIRTGETPWALAGQKIHRVRPSKQAARPWDIRPSSNQHRTATSRSSCGSRSWRTLIAAMASSGNSIVTRGVMQPRKAEARRVRITPPVHEHSRLRCARDAPGAAPAPSCSEGRAMAAQLRAFSDVKVLSLRHAECAHAMGIACKPV